MSNFAQTPSVMRAKLISIILERIPKNSKVTEMRPHPSVRQRFRYFGVIAIVTIVALALCWGFAHI